MGAPEVLDHRARHIGSITERRVSAGTAVGAAAPAEAAIARQIAGAGAARANNTGGGMQKRESSASGRTRDLIAILCLEAH